MFLTNAQNTTLQMDTLMLRIKTTATYFNKNVISINSELKYKFVIITINIV